LLSRLARRCRGRHAGSRLKGSAAVRAELVARVYAALAVRAGRLQAVAAAGTETEARLDLGIALRTGGCARLAQNEIEDDPQPVGDKDCNERPPQAAHPPPPSVPVYVTNQHDVAAEQCSRDDPQQ